jgi:hypothetical protein
VENGTFIDYYEFLMISPTADRQMIEWAARLMLARYDPRKSQTPDEAKCELVKEAFRTLAEPKRRAEYDAELSKQKPQPSVDIKGAITRTDVSNAQQLRRAIMMVLYQTMLQTPRNPDMGRTDLARLVGVATQDLEFGLWFLREKEWIIATQAGSYSITVEGAEWVESGGIPELAAADAAPKSSNFQEGLGALGRSISGKQSGQKPAALPPSSARDTDTAEEETVPLRLQQKTAI